MSQNIGIKKTADALLVKGKDSFRFLNGMLSQDVQKKSSGRSFFLTNKGKIICPLYFCTLNDSEIYLWTDSADFEVFYQNLNKYLIADQVELERLGTFESWTFVESEFSFSVLPTKNPLGMERIFQPLVDANICVAPMGLLSPSHAEVLFLKDKKQQSEECSDREIWRAYFDAGQPRWRFDMFPDDLILEFPLADAVSFDKGCYLGQETVARGTFRGKVNKCFSHFIAEKALEAGELTNEEGEKIGTIRQVFEGMGTGIAKMNLPPSGKYFLNAKEFFLEIEPMVNEKTFRQGR